MKERILAIFDEEEAYASALSGYLNKNKAMGFVTSAFSDKRKMLEYIKEGSSDYILATEEIDREELSGIFDEAKLIILSETRSERGRGPWIYKYQSAEAISKELSAILLIKAEGLICQDNNIQVVFSTKSGIEREKYVEILLADLMSKGSVLYLNMEPFSVQTRSEYTESKGMSELIYYLKQGEEGLKWRFKSLIERRGISGFVLPVSCAMDIYELTEEDTRSLIALLKASGEYDVVLINLGFFNQSALELIKAAGHIEVVITRNRGDRECAEWFIEQLKAMRLADLERRIEIVEFGTDTWI